MATLCVPSYANGVVSVMVVQLLLAKFTVPVNTLSALVTVIQSELPEKKLLSVLTK